MKKIIVKEYESIKVGEEGFKPSHLGLLEKYNKKKQFKIGNKKVTFKNYVGVVQVDNLTIEILPKIVDIDKNDKNKKQQKVLIDILKMCLKIKTHHNNTANISTKKISLLEFIYSSFMEEVSDVLHIGKVKKNRKIYSNVKACKGRMLFSQNIKHNLIHKERFFTEHQTYDFNNLFNKILKKALKIVSITSSSHNIAPMCKSLMSYFDSVTDITNIPKDIHYNRGNKHYKKAMEIAKLIISSHMPNVMHGQSHTIALLFDMNALFEEYVYRCLVKTKNKKKPSCYTITWKKNSLEWIEDNKKHSLKADIVVKNEKGDKIIIDTKWKVPKKSKATAQDLRQMYVYNMQYGLKDSILLYPYKENSKNVPKSLTFIKSKWTSNNFSHACHMEYFKLFNVENEKLNKNAEDIFARVEELLKII